MIQESNFGARKTSMLWRRCAGALGFELSVWIRMNRVVIKTLRKRTQHQEFEYDILFIMKEFIILFIMKELIL